MLREINSKIEIPTPVAYAILSSLEHLREGYQIDPEVDYPKLDTMIAVLRSRVNNESTD